MIICWGLLALIVIAFFLGYVIGSRDPFDKYLKQRWKRKERQK